VTDEAVASFQDSCSARCDNVNAPAPCGTSDHSPEPGVTREPTNHLLRRGRAQIELRRKGAHPACTRAGTMGALPA